MHLFQPKRGDKLKAHSPQFKENIKTLGRELDAKIIYGEEELTTEELNRVSIRYSSEFFRTIMKEVEFETSTKITANQWINVQAGIKVDGEYEYIDYGNYYIIKESEYNADIEGYTYIAYDKMIESMVFYDDNPLVIEYPVSYKDYIIQICNKLNWDYNLPVEFPNMNTEIKEDLYVGLGLTYRDILDDICPVSMGSFINDGTFKIIYPNETGDTIDDEFLKADNVVIGNKIGPINALVLSRVEDADTINRRDEESIEENGINEIKIKDNILLSSSFRENFIDEMFNKIKGFEYYAIDVATTGIMYYEPLDKFTINHDSINYPTIILNSELNIDDGIEELLYSPELEESVTNYETSSQTDKAKKMATIVAYKNKAEIELLAYELTETSENISTIELELSSINSSVKQIGGNNKQVNSVGAGGTDYEQSETGTIISLTTEDLRTTTQCGRAIQISDKWFKFKSSSLIIGNTYTASFKYSNTEFNDCLIKLINNTETTLVDTTEAKTLENIEYTFVANTEIVELYISSGSGTTLITDYYLQTGDVATNWQPAPGEVQSTTLTIYYNGVEVRSEDTETISKITSAGFMVTDLNGNIVITANKDKAIIKNLTVNGYIEQGDWKRYVQSINGFDVLLEVFE